MSLLVLRAGPSALVQDLGRPGHASLGVTASGAADRAAAATALRAVGTDPAAAVLEVLLGGLTVMTDEPAVVAVTGAKALVVVTPDGSRRTAATGEVLRLDAGSSLEIGRPVAGVRSYVGVRGGIDVPAVLGSRSRDTLAGLGPPPVVAGDVLDVGDAVVGPWADGWQVSAGRGVVGGGAVTGARKSVELDVIPGPRDDLFPPAAWDVLAATGHVSGHADRVGVRIDPARPVPRLDTREIPSEGMVRGAVQIPADGAPVVFGPDHPVTGGYPVIGVLTARSADAISQLLPGTPVRFRRLRGVAD
ncbi:biotin-dependent carboxyltransferase family protein [Dietzia sp. 111N12-1]|uniref:5-oxoprolinase subunit C family protein n=1 Tax=Dietzia sp. 111N12-1 TaxID=1785156 RepID=UPI00080603E4|nr:biotin-dependent carboxyltransferase family protein [Dietzia sp. 111N12-1]OAV76661.1 urea amidolyase [Dietzia sp. 111N12-1]